MEKAKAKLKLDVFCKAYGKGLTDQDQIMTSFPLIVAFHQFLEPFQAIFPHF